MNKEIQQHILHPHLVQHWNIGYFTTNSQIFSLPFIQCKIQNDYIIKQEMWEISMHMGDVDEAKTVRKYRNVDFSNGKLTFWQCYFINITTIF